MSIVLKGDISAFSAVPGILTHSSLAFRQPLLPGFVLPDYLGLHLHTHTHTHTHTDNSPSRKSTHPYSNWQLLLAHPSAEPLCSPAVFYQCNYSLGSGMNHWCGLMGWLVCLGANSKFAVYLKETPNMKGREWGRGRKRSEAKGMNVMVGRNGWSWVDKRKGNGWRERI